MRGESADFSAVAARERRALAGVEDSTPHPLWMAKSERWGQEGREGEKAPVAGWRLLAVGERRASKVKTAPPKVLSLLTMVQSVVSSRTDLDDDVVDVTSSSALDVAEINGSIRGGSIRGGRRQKANARFTS
jgi:hypothetical protein